MSRTQKIIVLGCSFSFQGHTKSWPDRVQQHFFRSYDNVKIINLAIPASSNQLQMLRLQEYLINNDIEQEDIVIWQVTGTVRRHGRFKSTEEITKKGTTGSTYEGSINYFDNQNRIDCLCHHPETFRMMIDEPEILQQLLFNFKVLKKFTNKLLVIRGWDGDIPENYLEKFYNFLDKNNISFIKESIMSHGTDNNYPLAEDKMHPSTETYFSFVDRKIIPTIKSLGWL